MLGSGKSSGVVNEASNLKANENLTATIEHMATRAYAETRQMDDVIPTHRHHLAATTSSSSASSGQSSLPVYDPAAERARDARARRCGDDEGGGVDKENDCTALAAADNDDNDDDDDLELRELRRLRAQHMKQRVAHEAEWRGKQHGQYREIAQDDFFSVVVREKGGSARCVVHFYHADFVRCKVLDRRLSELAQQLLPVRFVKIAAASAPFLVERLRVTTLPCCLLFKDDVCVDRIVGFEGCTSSDDDAGDAALDPELLRERIERTLCADLAAC